MSKKKAADKPAKKSAKVADKKKSSKGKKSTAKKSTKAKGARAAIREKLNKPAKASTDLGYKTLFGA